MLVKQLSIADITKKTTKIPIVTSFMFKLVSL